MANPQRLYYKCDDCGIIRWCVGSLFNHPFPPKFEDGSSSINTEESKKMKEELKELKKSIKKQKKLLQNVISLCVVVLVAIVMYFIMK